MTYFKIILRYKYSYLVTYLLTDESLVKDIYGSSVEKLVQTTWCELKLLLEGPECYKDSHIN